ncbi:beta-lactamase-like protein [Talaromyces proteolyticus]|uniref:Beta-lactamase-like protein n=1 Tax=Talaromyces proteolyticus TaxID=1131652 RepID=A0AAD4KLV6_9EURO|nr:beta-lactamase-like protein [Talaromyces proteolyticus]KAH8695628.1 beta-lactamase-like protein [Talaromyces proteolyticus]
MACQIQFPRSISTVRVRLIDTTGVMVSRSKPLIQPEEPMLEYLNIYVAAFLVEHKPSGKKIMFDLGIRKDYWNYPAILQKRLSEVIPALRVEKDVTEILKENGIQLDEISTVVWSHYHWDHIGNTAAFPSTTELVVGPGFKLAPNILPGYPLDPHSPVEAQIFANRTLREVDFASTDLHIGDYPAHDFFGDGSFYLLDTPGHCIGHICGLARTTADPESSFLLLGGDICHFPGVFRPSQQMPLPDPIPRGVLDPAKNFPLLCPCTLFTDNHPRRFMASFGDERRTPFFLIPTDANSSAYIDPKTAQGSVESLIAFDSHPDVMVCLAHDEDLVKKLPTLNNSPDNDLNSWKQRGLKDKITWTWLNHLPHNGQAGENFAVEGFWRDGQHWPSAKDELGVKGREALGA